MQHLVSVIPLAVVMVAGPQIISAIMLATSERARKNSFGYVGGAVLATLIATAVFYSAAKALGLKASGVSSGSVAVNWILVAVLLAAAIRVYVRRTETEPPQWMGKLQHATPALSFRIGVLLFLLMPTDLMMTFTVGSYLASHDLPLSYAAGFWFLTALFIGSPLLVLLIMGKRADATLPAMREWMNSNSWVVSEAVLVFFLVMQIRAIVGT